MKEEHAQQIAEQWLTSAAESAGQKDLEHHMGMISRLVASRVFPGLITLITIHGIRNADISLKMP